MIRNVPGTEVSLREHSNTDGNLALLELMMEATLITNFLVESVGKDNGLKSV